MVMVNRDEVTGFVRRDCRLAMPAASFIEGLLVLGCGLDGLALGHG
jgi:hypothetical protein